MLAKAGFILAVLLLGLLSFIAGTMAPDDLRNRVSTQVRPILNKLPLAELGLVAEDAVEQKTGKKLPELPKAIEYTALNLPDILPEKAVYALEVDMAVEPTTIARWVALLKRHHYPSHEILIKGPDALEWTVIAAGSYANPEDARQARLNILQDIAEVQHSNLRVITVPPNKPKDKKAAAPTTAKEMATLEAKAVGH